MLCLAALTLCAAPARAGSYAVSFSNGSYDDGNGQTAVPDYDDGGGDYYTYDPDDPQGGVYSTGSTFTVTCTWVPDDPSDLPPQNAVLDEEGYAYWESGDGTLDGSCADGLGDPEVDNTDSLPYITSGVLPGTPASLDHYSVHAGGASFTFERTATVSPGGDNNCYMYYSVGVTPDPIVLTGATKDSSGNYHILIGQKCQASITGLPGSNITYSWSGLSTTNTFQKWDPSTTPPTYVSGPGALNVASPSWYWNEAATTETITCTATVTPPAGKGAPFPVTDTQKVSVEVPTMSVSALAVGTGRINNNPISAAKGPGYYLYDGSTLKGQNPDPTQDHGEFWAGSVTTPALFPAGTWNFAQIITPSSTYTGPDGNTHNLANYGITGLDTSFPYGNSLPADGSAAGEGDPPGEQLLDANSVYNVNDQFQTYLMFMPSGGVWVPLGLLNNWSFVATNIMRPSSGGWSKYTPTSGVGTPTPGGAFAPNHTFPTWTAVDK